MVLRKRKVQKLKEVKPDKTANLANAVTRCHPYTRGFHRNNSALSQQESFTSWPILQNVSFFELFDKLTMLYYGCACYGTILHLHFFAGLSFRYETQFLILHSNRTTSPITLNRVMITF
ncbi:hypothetical protein TNCT_473381 [Trichonephila clavata]|uniref:Uncharacterized protein n=1 Tax=Trichonephila clavata TaxID=2740835 RepID=A0A8X6HN75_TRICU|nr:hypothetical protein TNCT_473381 [Trichonephila clavata]